MSNNPDEIKEYKIYNQKLNKLISQAKKNYFDLQFSLNKGNMKTTWKLIDMIISRNKKKVTSISKLLYNNQCYTDQKTICDKLNEHFINVAPKLASQLPQTSETDPTMFIKQTFPNSLA